MMGWDVAIVGGGPAGLLAATRAAERGRKTILLDKNREPGIKILLSGGTRCNLTHATDARGIVEAFGPAGRFLHSALAALSPEQVVNLFEAEGVPTKIEPGGKVFPRSDRAADVRAALLRRLRRSGCTLALAEPLADLVPLDAGFQLVTPLRRIDAEKVVLATGGQSYPACGTTGDGYRWAAALGHRIVAPHTALAPITTHASWVLALQGVTLPEVFARVIDPGGRSSPLKKGTGVELVDASTAKNGGCEAPVPLLQKGVSGEGKAECLASRRGAVLFAHFGLSGPVVMDLSHFVSGHPRPSTLLLRCDLLPDLSEEEVDARLASGSRSAGKRRVAALLDRWLPHRVGETLVALAGMPPERSAAEFSKGERRQLVSAIKRLDIPVAGTMGFRKAEVTAGGVSLAEVDSRTVQSRIVPNLYFAGELLDLNGPVGGYNFQAAFSTGWLAGESV
jgi:predicted flavoprotein YhiN